MKCRSALYGGGFVKSHLMVYCLSLLTCISLQCLLISDPELIYDKAQTGEEGFERALEMFPANFSLKQLQPELSGIKACDF